MKRAYSLRSRTALFIALSFSLFLTAFVLFSYLSIRSSLIARSDEEARQEVRDVLHELRDSSNHRSLDDILQRHSTTGESRLTISVYKVAESGLVALTPTRATSSPALQSREMIALAADSNQVLSVRTAQTAYRLCAIRSGEFIAVAAMDMIVIDETRDAMLQQFGVTLILGLIASVILGFLVAGLSLAPIRLLIEAAKHLQSAPPQLGTGEAGMRRLPIPDGIAEVALLARTVNRLIDDRERSIEQLLNFTADAAHELRTPLTVLKGELEVELRLTTNDNPSYETFRSNLEEVERLSAIVEDLLVLAKLDQHEPSSSSSNAPIEVAEIIAKVVNRLVALAESRSIPIRTENLPALVIISNSERFERLVYNLLHNAILYSEAGRPIEISIEDLKEKKAIVIRDQGIGIAPADLPHVFERFYRAEKSRSRAVGGAGLGLSIAKAIAEESGVVLELTSVPSEGTTAYIIFP